MADQNKVLRGLVILTGLKPDGVSYECNAVHDELFAAGPHPSDIDAAEVQELEALGWRWCEKEESWAVFT